MSNFFFYVRIAFLGSHNIVVHFGVRHNINRVYMASSNRLHRYTCRLFPYHRRRGRRRRGSPYYITRGGP